MLSILNETDNKNFYPTPLHLITKMESKVKRWDFIQSVLEPSAGKGDIVEVLSQRNKYRSDKIDIDCIEIDQNLQHILRGNGYKVVHDDFLNYKGYKRYQLIIMNPPFDCGDKHLLKALDMQKRGGEIVCLLNADTLLNPYSNTRKDLVRKLDELNADIEFINDGFVNAERKTSVKIALIHVEITPEKSEKYNSFIVEDLKRAKEVEHETIEATQITDKLGFLDQIVEQFNFEVEGGLRLIREYEAYQPYMYREFEQLDEKGNNKNYGCYKSLLTLSIVNDDRNYNQTVDSNEYVKLVRYKYWKALFSNQEFTKNLTSNLVRKYHENIEKMVDYDFTLFNIKAIQFEMSKNVIQGVEDTIVDLFEEFSHKHYYYDEMSNNIHYYNGWKTNNCYMVNKKVIIPLSGYYDLAYSWGGYRPDNNDVLYKLRDIQKVFDYLDGGLTEDIDILQQLEQAKANEQTKKIPLKYFTVTFYKKGTCHIEFTNADLLKKFNIFGCQRKGWLPPAYGKKKYNDMTQEEKTVVDNFEGEKEYNKVMVNKQYFIAETVNLLSLPEAI